MNQIFLIGAGRSSNYLINFLLNEAETHDLHLLVGDVDVELAESKIQGHPRGKAIQFDIQNDSVAEKHIGEADLVISMLPPKFHSVVGQHCLEKGKNLLTASYNTPEMMELDEQAKEKGLLFLMEMGLDPGIDHMSAMKVLHELEEGGYVIHAFETFTGGLLAPHENDNPWNYKFTWNPRNVVTAGQGIVKFIQEGRFKYIPYYRLFRRTERIFIPGHGYFEGYANRDSLKYREIYGLEDVKTLYRGTLRRPGFSRAWNNLVQLGATDDQYEMEGLESMTHREFTNSFLPFNPHDSVELKFAHYLNLDIQGEEMFMLQWLGLFEDQKIGIKEGSPAVVLEHILKKKWTMGAEDRDMIIMFHKFVYHEKGKEDEKRELNSHMVVLGEDETNTSMAKTVGLPLAVAAKLIMADKINAKGVCLPITKEIYKPVLEELGKVGITFHERMIEEES